MAPKKQRDFRAPALDAMRAQQDAQAKATAAAAAKALADAPFLRAIPSAPDVPAHVRVKALEILRDTPQLRVPLRAGWAFLERAAVLRAAELQRDDADNATPVMTPAPAAVAAAAAGSAGAAGAGGGSDSNSSNTSSTFLRDALIAEFAGLENTNVAGAFYALTYSTNISVAATAAAAHTHSLTRFNASGVAHGDPTPQQDRTTRAAMALIVSSLLSYGLRYSLSFTFDERTAAMAVPPAQAPVPGTGVLAARHVRATMFQCWMHTRQQPLCHAILDAADLERHGAYAAFGLSAADADASVAAAAAGASADSTPPAKRAKPSAAATPWPALTTTAHPAPAAAAAAAAAAAVAATGAPPAGPLQLGWPSPTQSVCEPWLYRALNTLPHGSVRDSPLCGPFAGHGSDLHYALYLRVLARSDWARSINAPGRLNPLHAGFRSLFGAGSGWYLAGYAVELVQVLLQGVSLPDGNGVDISVTCRPFDRDNCVDTDTPRGVVSCFDYYASVWAQSLPTPMGNLIEQVRQVLALRAQIMHTVSTVHAYRSAITREAFGGAPAAPASVAAVSNGAAVPAPWLHGVCEPLRVPVLRDLIRAYLLQPLHDERVLSVEVSQPRHELDVRISAPDFNPDGQPQPRSLLG